MIIGLHVVYHGTCRRRYFIPRHLISSKHLLSYRAVIISNITPKVHHNDPKSNHEEPETRKRDCLICGDLNFSRLVVKPMDIRNLVVLRNVDVCW